MSKVEITEKNLIIRPESNKKKLVPEDIKI